MSAEDERGSSDEPIVVGIGASAGGQEALARFFGHLPPDSGMAFVVVQHLAPTHASLLAELLSRHTTMPVTQVTEGEVPAPNHVYVIPPNANLALFDAGFALLGPTAASNPRMPVDYFFRSLAEQRGARAVAVILSGAGSDGSLGLRAVKERGGLVLAQAPSTAGHGGMPQSAIDTGLVDFVLPPDELAPRLLAYFQHPYAVEDAAPRAADARPLAHVLALLKERTGHDFSLYKRKTLERRIARRVALHQLAGVADYVRYLKGDPVEAQALFRELLIGVTSFFRDPEAFAALEEKVLPRLFAGRTPDDPVRVWVPGCSSGEEAYSLAILLHEQRARLAPDANLQIFATDLDPEAIRRARAGRYADNIAADVGTARLQRFFVRDGDAWVVRDHVRADVLFAVQSVIQDPPFSRVDLISCRNLLIYLDPTLQRRVLTTLHYALKSGGFLFLGSAESPDEIPNLFAPLDRKARLFERVGLAGTLALTPMTFARPARPQDGVPPQTIGSEEALRASVERTLLEEAPASIVVQTDGEILFVHGRTGRYLEVPPGKASANVFRMAREGLRGPLTSLVARAAKKGERIAIEDVRVKHGDRTAVVRASARPGPIDKTVLVQLEEVTPPQEKGARPAIPSEASRLAEVELELEATREHLQATIQDLETANEELRSTNEEIQSANEELMTSREELQSVNEELVTLNTEHETKIEQLTRVRNDQANAFTQLDIGIIFLDRKLCIRQFNPAATRISNLLPGDVGRPLSDMVTKIDYRAMVGDAKAVFETLVPKEVEVSSDDGRFYSVHLRPYRTVDNLIDGVTLTFYDITARRRAEEILAADHAALGRVQDACARLAGAETFSDLAQLVVDGAADVCAADVVYLRLFDDRGAPLASHRGLDAGLASALGAARFEAEAWGGALHRGERVTIDDLAGPLAKATPELAILKTAGVRAASCLPLQTRAGAVLGALVLCSRAAEPLPETMWLLLGLLARVAANLIEHRRRAEKRGA